MMLWRHLDALMEIISSHKNSNSFINQTESVQAKLTNDHKSPLAATYPSVTWHIRQTCSQKSAQEEVGSWTVGGSHRGADLIALGRSDGRAVTRGCVEMRSVFSHLQQLSADASAQRSRVLLAGILLAHRGDKCARTSLIVNLGLDSAPAVV